MARRRWQAAKNLGKTQKNLRAETEKSAHALGAESKRTEHEFELTETVGRHAAQRPIVGAACAARAGSGHHSAATTAIGSASASVGANIRVGGIRGERGGRRDRDDRCAHRREDALLVGQTRLAAAVDINREIYGRENWKQEKNIV